MITEITILEALGYSLVGMAVVFLMLILLMVVIYIIGAIFARKDKQPGAPGKKPAAASASGELNGAVLSGVDEETAGALMELVAEKIGKPSEDIKFSGVKRINK